MEAAAFDFVKKFFDDFRHLVKLAAFDWTRCDGEAASLRDNSQCCPAMEVAGSLLWFSSNHVLGDFSVVGNEGEVYGYGDFLAEGSFARCYKEDLLVEFVEHASGFCPVYLFEAE